MLNWILNSGNWGLGLLLAAIGIGLIGIAAIDMFKSVKGDTKNWAAFIVGLLIGLLGGFFLVVGATGFINIFKSKSNEVPRA